MEKLLVKGEKVVVSRIKDPSQQMVFEFIYPKLSHVVYDIDVFIVPMDEKGRVVKDNIIFYGNPKSEGDGISYEESYEALQVKKEVEITLNRLSEPIEKICLACSIYCKDKNRLEESVYTNLKMDARNKTLRSHMFVSEEKIDIKKDQVVIMGELYKYRDTWKYNAVKQNLDERLMIALKKLYDLKVY